MWWLDRLGEGAKLPVYRSTSCELDRVAAVRQTHCGFCWISAVHASSAAAAGDAAPDAELIGKADPLAEPVAGREPEAEPAGRGTVDVLGRLSIGVDLVDLLAP